MSLIEHSVTLTPDELHCLTCAMAGNFPERFAPIRTDLLRKLAKAQHTNTRGAVSSFERIGKLAAWIERDRRESDKVLAYAQELARLSTPNRGQS